MSHKNLKKQVIEVLREFPNTRNNDSLLIIEFYRKFYFLPDPCNHAKLLQIMMYCPVSSLIRVRTQIQNVDKMYQPTAEEVKKFRRQNEDKFKLIYGHKEPSAMFIREEYNLDKELDRKLTNLFE